jgi:hypothetical protein
MYNYDLDQDAFKSIDNDNIPELLDDHKEERLNESTDDTEQTYNKHTVSSTTITDNGLLAKFIHVIQFCVLCAARKIPPVLYIAMDQEALLWFDSTLIKCGLATKNSGK